MRIEVWCGIKLNQHLCFLRESIIFTSNFYYCLFGTFFFILLMQLSNMKTFCFIKGDKVLQEKTYGVGAISKGRIQNKYF